MKKLLTAILLFFPAAATFADTSTPALTPTLKGGNYCNIITIGREWRITQITVNAEKK